MMDWNGSVHDWEWPDTVMRLAGMTLQLAGRVIRLAERALRLIRRVLRLMWIVLEPGCEDPETGSGP